MKQVIKTILVDDHQIIRDGIANMLREADDILLCGCAPDYCSALELIRQSDPDVVITDLSLPGKSGIDLIRKIREVFPSVHVLVLSMYVSEDYIFNALKAGAWGYLPKQDTTKGELFKAIRTLFKGEQYFSNSIAQVITRLYSHSVKQATLPESISKTHSLTARESEILRLYAEGYSNQEISEKLNISVRTVETHKNNIMQKYNFRSTVDMLKFAIRNNLAEL
ncbi:MAG: response regulator transcription factor [Bacteroidales bacterium]|jgi:DNA-binding NarL/FixJ family response regulator|nr:response regulator transcription factor [Bacteroidales bacterium]